MTNIFLIAGISLALSFPVYAQDKKEANPPVKVDLKNVKIEKPDAKKAKEAEKAPQPKSDKKDTKSAPVKFSKAHSSASFSASPRR